MVPTLEARQKLDKIFLGLPCQFRTVRAVVAGFCDVCLRQHAVSQADFEFVLAAVNVNKSAVDLLSGGGTEAGAVGEEFDRFSDR